MKKFLACLLTLIATQTFALDNCLSFPVMNEEEVTYTGEISEVSDVTSFAGCPASTLINERIVMTLSQVVTYKEEKRCVYSNGRVFIMCNK